VFFSGGLQLHKHKHKLEKEIVLQTKWDRSQLGWVERSPSSAPKPQA
jgi:hypothetical protein